MKNNSIMTQGKIVKGGTNPPNTSKSRPQAPEGSGMKLKDPLEQIFYICAGDIPHKFQDDCLDLDDEFPLHYSTGVVWIDKDDSKNPFVKWLIELGFKFDQRDGDYGLLGVSGT